MDIKAAVAIAPNKPFAQYAGVLVTHLSIESAGGHGPT